MYIRNLYVEQFRLLQNKSFELGKYITAIAGYNTTGKSTILGLLGQCGKLGKEYKPLLHACFKAELNEIIKFSKGYDEPIAQIGTITFDDVPVLEHSDYPTALSYRSTWQQYKDGNNRYRIIPKPTKTRPTVNKIEWPTLYLGLGRLYPVGESININNYSLTKRMQLHEEKAIIRDMSKILSTDENVTNITALSIRDIKKKAVGVNTDKYDSRANSAGQNNLGQILMAILSFRKLKEQLKDKWFGGILLIDELDAALHPLAQDRLLDFMYRQAKDIGIQIVFTSHSLSLLKHICTKTEHNSSAVVNECELIYIRRSNDVLEVSQNPQFEAIFYDLTLTTDQAVHNKISVFSEDEEARMLIERMLYKYSHRFNLVEVPFGCDDLLRILSSDYKHFRNNIFILDGDVGNHKIEKCRLETGEHNLRCIAKLPGTKRPEQMIFEYIMTMQITHKFIREHGSRGFSRQYFRENGPESPKYGNREEREKYKQWFKDNNSILTTVISYWCEDNQATVAAFVKEFVDAYNWVASKNFMPRIRIES